MEIYENIEIKDLGLYFKKEKYFVIADLHIGLEEALNKQGYLIPRFQFNDLIKRLDKVFKNLDVKKIIINGDLKHEFGEISRQEWKSTLELLDYLLEKGEVILVKGNHDNILGPIADKKNLKIAERFDFGNVSVVHGDRIFKDLNKIVVIGHEHPAVSLEKFGRREVFKCFLKGKYKNKILIVIPSSNLVREGSDVLKEEVLSPYIKNIKGFRVFIVEDKVYDFGKIGNIK